MNLEKEFRFFPFHISYLAYTLKNLVYTDSILVRRRIPNFWTIGLATYKDGYNTDEHWKPIIQNNSELWNMFRPFYKFQLDYFTWHLGAPCRYMEGMPMPGFHVFKYCKEFEQPLARPHVDVPFNKYDWGKDVGYDNIFTHVIPVELPKGAGMNVWELDAMDMHKEGAETIVTRARTTKPDHFIEHKVDRMCLHSGKWVHQIRPFSEPTDQWRITLQSHAVFMDGYWNLYW